jgi:hypothetical protein
MHMALDKSTQKIVDRCWETVEVILEAPRSGHCKLGITFDVKARRIAYRSELMRHLVVLAEDLRVKQAMQIEAELQKRTRRDLRRHVSRKAGPYFDYNPSVGGKDVENNDRRYVVYLAFCEKFPGESMNGRFCLDMDRKAKTNSPRFSRFFNRLKDAKDAAQKLDDGKYSLWLREFAYPRNGDAKGGDSANWYYFWWNTKAGSDDNLGSPQRRGIGYVYSDDAIQSKTVVPYKISKSVPLSEA